MWKNRVYSGPVLPQYCMFAGTSIYVAEPGLFRHSSATILHVCRDEYVCGRTGFFPAQFCHSIACLKERVCSAHHSKINWLYFLCMHYMVWVCINVLFQIAVIEVNKKLNFMLINRTPFYKILVTLLTLNTENSNFGVNSISVDALARSPAGMVLVGRTDNIYGCSRRNFIYLIQTKPKRRFKMRNLL